MILYFNEACAAASKAAGAGIQNPHAILILTALGNMGVSIKCRLRMHSPGFGNQHGSICFYAVFMTMGHEKPHTADIIAKPVMYPWRTTVHIAVAGDLMQRNMGIQFSQSFSVIVVITQVYNGLGFYCFHTAAHKTHS